MLTLTNATVFWRDQADNGKQTFGVKDEDGNKMFLVTFPTNKDFRSGAESPNAMHGAAWDELVPADKENGIEATKADIQIRYHKNGQYHHYYLKDFTIVS